MTSASDEKWRPFNCFFQSREQVVVQRSQIQRMGWVIKTMEAQIGQFIPGCKCPVSRGIVVQEQDPLGDLPVAISLQNVLQLHQQRWVILRIDIVALFKVISEEGAVLIPKNRGENFSSGFLRSEFFLWQLTSPCCWNRARGLTCFRSASVTRKDLQFSTWTDLSFQRHYRFRPMTSESRSG